MRAILTAAALSVALVQGVALFAQGNVPELAFDANTDVVRTPPNIYLGEVAGVGRTSQGRIFVYTRTGHPYATLGDNRTFYRGGSRLFEFDASGKFVRELGQDVYGFNTAFGLRVDPQDNVWTIDQSASQVVKFDKEGRLLLVLGRKPEAINVRPAAAGAAPSGEEGGGGGRAPRSQVGRDALRLRRAQGRRQRLRNRDHRVLPRPDGQVQGAAHRGVRRAAQNRDR
jgi:hypothetical protein